VPSFFPRELNVDESADKLVATDDDCVCVCVYTCNKMDRLDHTSAVRGLVAGSFPRQGVAKTSYGGGFFSDTDPILLRLFR